MKRVIVKYQALFLLPNICNGKGGAIFKQNKIEGIDEKDKRDERDERDKKSDSLIIKKKPSLFITAKVLNILMAFKTFKYKNYFIYSVN
ncbi:hypothetical protein BTA34_02820 [Proteus sp. CD3]|nr:hypothetical protein BTA34_02820 [Proteus sp. CD3]